MAWTPPADAIEVKAAPVKAKAWAPPTDAVETQAPAPGWFEPGSKSEAALRGFSQGATLGFGDEIQALMRTIGSDQTYTQLRDQERGANSAAAEANPGSYIAGNVAGSIPAGYAGLRSGAGALLAKQGAIGAATGAGSSEAEDLSGIAGDAAKGAAIQAGTAGAVRGLGNLPKATQTTAAMRAAAPEKVAQLEATKGRIAANVAANATGRNDVRNAAIGGVAGPLFFGTSVEGGAAAGVAIGRGSSPTGKVAKAAGRAVVGAAGRMGPAGGTNATILALQNMSGQDARKINTDVRAQIDAEAAAGRPVYAATFSALNASPAYRVASEKVAAEGEVEDEEQE